jgi:hypothetical protein
MNTTAACRQEISRARRLPRADFLVLPANSAPDQRRVALVVQHRNKLFTTLFPIFGYG